MSPEPITAYHFLNEDRRLRYGDDRLVEVGKTYSLPEQEHVELCKSGMHASIRGIDALGYAPGPIICRVEVWGDVIRDDNKLVGRHRKVLAMADATRTLHEFAVDQAKGALEAANVTDERCFAALEAKLLWLDGKVTDDDLARARAAVWYATWDAASAAASGAARDAAWDAAWDAAKVVASDAAWGACNYAAKATESRDAASVAANQSLEARLNALLRDDPEAAA